MSVSLASVSPPVPSHAGLALALRLLDEGKMAEGGSRDEGRRALLGGAWLRSLPCRTAGLTHSLPLTANKSKPVLRSCLDLHLGHVCLHPGFFAKLGLSGPALGPEPRAEALFIKWTHFPFCFSQTAVEWVEKMPKGPPPECPKDAANLEILALLHKAVTSRYHAIAQEFENFDTMKTNTASRDEFRAICTRHVQILTDEQVRMRLAERPKPRRHAGVRPAPPATRSLRLLFIVKILAGLWSAGWGGEWILLLFCFVLKLTSDSQEPSVYRLGLSCTVSIRATGGMWRPEQTHPAPGVWQLQGQ